MIPIPSPIPEIPIPVFLITDESPFEPDRCEAALAYLIDGEGWAVYKRNGIFEGVVRLKDGPFGGLVEEFASLYSWARVPKEILHQIIGFFRDVYKEHNSEGCAFLYHNEDELAWRVVVPPQEVSPARVMMGAAEARLDGGWKLAMTIHSHPGFSAFHSTTDDEHNKDMDGLHVTIGHVNRGTPEFACSLMVNGERTKLALEDCFDVDSEDYKYPAEWLEQVKKASVVIGPQQVSHNPLERPWNHNYLTDDEYARAPHERDGRKKGGKDGRRGGFGWEWGY